MVQEGIKWLVPISIFLGLLGLAAVIVTGPTRGIKKPTKPTRSPSLLRRYCTKGAEDI